MICHLTCSVTARGWGAFFRNETEPKGLQHERYAQAKTKGRSYMHFLMCIQDSVWKSTYMQYPDITKTMPLSIKRAGIWHLDVIQGEGCVAGSEASRRGAPRTGRWYVRPSATKKLVDRTARKQKRRPLALCVSVLQFSRQSCIRDVAREEELAPKFQSKLRQRLLWTQWRLRVDWELLENNDVLKIGLAVVMNIGIGSNITMCPRCRNIWHRGEEEVVEAGLHCPSFVD